MRRQLYYPSRIRDQVNWLDNYATQLPGSLTCIFTLIARMKLSAGYTGPKSLQVKFQALKNEVKGQNGQDSAEAVSVRGVKW